MEVNVHIRPYWVDSVPDVPNVAPLNKALLRTIVECEQRAAPYRPFRECVERAVSWIVTHGGWPSRKVAA